MLDKIISLAKRRGFVFPGSEIYGGLSGTYDYGPHGTALLRNIKELWRSAISQNHEVAFIEASIFSSPKVWEASGHISGFSDPLVICNKCKTKLRADHLLEKIGVVADEKISEEKINEIFDENRKKLVCPTCGAKDFGRVRSVNLMATSNFGSLEAGDPTMYLRAETAQSTYINYKNILDTGLYSIPFGIAQIGKVFRNEISARQFLFRMREFEQMEVQYFVRPIEASAVYEEWKKERLQYYIDLGITKNKLRFKEHDNLVFYAKAAWDIQYEFPFGWNELEGLHHRGDYDLSQHQKFSGVDMSVFYEETKEKYIPNVIEAAVGADRTVLMVLCDAYHEDEMNGEKRVVLRFNPKIAPVKVAVFPLLKNKPELVAKAREIYTNLKKEIPQSMWDDNGNIGKRYRRQDEIGTPWCVTIDYQTLDDNTVTVRDRDTGTQTRHSIAELDEYFKEMLV